MKVAAAKVLHCISISTEIADRCIKHTLRWAELPRTCLKPTWLSLDVKILRRSYRSSRSFGRSRRLMYMKSVLLPGKAAWTGLARWLFQKRLRASEIGPCPAMIFLPEWVFGEGLFDSVIFIFKPSFNSLSAQPGHASQSWRNQSKKLSTINILLVSNIPTGRCSCWVRDL